MERTYNNPNHEKFIQEVFETLLRRHPDGMTSTALERKIRSKYDSNLGVPRINNLPKIDSKSFIFAVDLNINAGTKLYAIPTSPRAGKVVGISRGDQVAETHPATSAMASTEEIPKSSPPPAVKSTSVQELFQKEKFLQDVYNVLYSRPKGTAPQYLSTLVRRNAYKKAPRFIQLERVEPISFRIENGKLFAKENSFRAQRLLKTKFSTFSGFNGVKESNLPATGTSSSPTRNASTAVSTNVSDTKPSKERRDEAADHFYEYLQSYLANKPSVETKDIRYDDVKLIHQRWLSAGPHRCGLYYMIQNFVATGRVRYRRNKTMAFRFLDVTGIDVDRLKASKGGIEISDIVFPASTSPNEVVATTATIRNLGDEDRMLTGIDLLQLPEVFSTSLRSPLLIPANSDVDFNLQARSTVIGIHASSLLFSFDGFSILRTFQVTISEDPELREILQPSVPPPKKNKSRYPRRPRTKNVIEGERPKGSGVPFKIHPAAEYLIPRSIKEREETGEIQIDLEELMEEVNQALSSNDTVTNEHKQQSLLYYQMMQDCMLYVEECQMNRDIRQYDLEEIVLTRVPNDPSFFYLDVPGLAEKRPSVLIGDFVDVYPSSSKPKIGENNAENEALEVPIKYRGYVWEVQQSKVKLRFNPKFTQSFIAGEQYHVEFSFRRTPLQIMHDVLYRLQDKCSLANDNHGDEDIRSVIGRLHHIVLPKESCFQDVNSLPPSGSSSIHWYNTRLNRKQKDAVSVMIQSSSTTHPFILFGPPGTGKTVTLVEAIKQLYRQLNQERSSSSVLSALKAMFVSKPKHRLILVMAPSNYAADLLLTRLKDSVNKSDMFRYMSYSRPFNDVNPDVLDYCQADGNKHFIIPSVDQLRSYKVIVSTCSMASRLFYYGLKPSDVAACIIDESGHCWEMEAMAAFLNLIDNNVAQKIILAGDPMQLGPIARSPFAEFTGFNLSLLERYVMKNDVFRCDPDRFPDSNGYNPKFIVKLTESYRCHPEIIRIPNELFYHNDLISKADPAITHSLLGWEKLPTENFPMLFHGCIGENQQEAKSPSWFNISEVELVIKYVQSLIEYSRRGAFSTSDIGIITPYSRQVFKIREALKAKKLDGCMVGSCEQFQGQERRIIIISTVRSSLEYMPQDTLFNIGFLRNPKRFNVAITRAKALVVIIGNPHVLSGDDCWGRMLWHCVDNQSYVGTPLPARPHVGSSGPSGGDDEDDDDLNAMLQQLHLQSTGPDVNTAADVSVNEQVWTQED